MLGQVPVGQVAGRLPPPQVISQLPLSPRSVGRPGERDAVLHGRSCPDELHSLPGSVCLFFVDLTYHLLVGRLDGRGELAYRKVGDLFVPVGRSLAPVPGL